MSPFSIFITTGLFNGQIWMNGQVWPATGIMDFALKFYLE